MSELQSAQRTGARAGYARASAEPSVQWIRSETADYVPPALTKAERRARSDNSTALLVIGLTVACTLLAIFDLFQLAAGF